MVIVHVNNNSPYNITVHWYLHCPTLYLYQLSRVTHLNSEHVAVLNRHGLFQRGTQWADGPEMVTQCPIRPDRSYTYRYNATGQEGTLWWHAHSSMLRATVHGAIVIKPRNGELGYPFPKPDKEEIVMLGTSF